LFKQIITITVGNGNGIALGHTSLIRLTICITCRIFRYSDLPIFDAN